MRYHRLAANVAGQCGIFALSVAGLLLAAGGPSQAQVQSLRPAPPAPAVHPPANIDPGIKVAPKSRTRLPTPVIHPPVARGDTVVVPK